MVILKAFRLILAVFASGVALYTAFTGHILFPIYYLILAISLIFVCTGVERLQSSDRNRGAYADFALAAAFILAVVFVDWW
ncbi:hypothetical protein [Jeotgalibacillus salarius]|uniref:DUF3953 domain-containing protein n=1 Tax=Jeotgalibacillus salarius TaxID=546023 RepID=A0A4Y8LAX6_9BACL|nr:hypothetical protein [Jeotgalibacillus salarius]TFD99781.1 hypothetical protein E2626_13445 [Jeotgalibacillus salarius]